MFEEQGVKSVSIVHSTKEATADLAKVVLHPFDPAITDFKPIINKIKLQDKPEVILMSAYENDYAGIAPTWR
jgi:branched-chain amino acid transport system substrate-binding protein